MHGRLHEAWRSPHDDRGSPPARRPPRVEQIPVDAVENPRGDHPDRPLDADPLADGESRLRGAELRRDVG